jgi:hypothetical protein
MPELRVGVAVIWDVASRPLAMFLFEERKTKQ